jgi:hypothetical protein
VIKGNITTKLISIEINNNTITKRGTQAKKGTPIKQKAPLATKGTPIKEKAHVPVTKGTPTKEKLIIETILETPSKQKAQASLSNPCKEKRPKQPITPKVRRL